jgi:uncharacterized coiled-coil DUF342 family protein
MGGETFELLRVAATGGAAGAGAVIAYITSRTFVETVKVWLDDRRSARETSSAHDRELVPILRDDAATQRAELWSEIRALRNELREVRVELEESFRREAECERRHAEASAHFTSEIASLRAKIDTLSASTVTT